MKISYECGPCFLRQAREALDLSTDDEMVKMELMEELQALFADSDIDAAYKISTLPSDYPAWVVRFIEWLFYGGISRKIGHSLIFFLFLKLARILRYMFSERIDLKNMK